MIIGGMSGRRAMHPGMARRPVFFVPVPGAHAGRVRSAGEEGARSLRFAGGDAADSGGPLY
jgi:hypothetical protein